MSRPVLQRLLAAAALALLGSAACADDPDDRPERQRIERDRQAVQARYVQAEQACQTRFQTTDCLDTARAERRQALDRLRREQVVLDDARRRARAADRLQAQQRRLSEREAQALLAVPQPAGASAAASAAGARPTSAATPSRAASGRTQGPDSAPPAQPATRPASAEDARAAHNMTAYQRRQQQLRQHADEVQRRNAARDARKPPAAGLPQP